jgi:hypothetical protein
MVIFFIICSFLFIYIPEPTNLGKGHNSILLREANTVKILLLSLLIVPCQAMKTSIATFLEGLEIENSFYNFF